MWLTRVTIASNVSIKVTNIVKDRSLKGRFRDTNYPSNSVPFYLYGAPNDLNIDHILVRAPNIQLSADNIQLSLSKSLDPVTLARGAILLINGISEASMQPFQSTEGPLGDTLAADSNFFFRPGQEFKVSVYEDARAAGEPGPGLVDLQNSIMLGEGTMTLGEGRLVDSVQLNRDPFEMKEGDGKFKASKKIFDQIGKELE